MTQTTETTPTDTLHPGPGDTDVLPACMGALSALAVAGALVPFRDTLGGTNVALILVVVIVAAASIGGRLAGAVTAVMASLAFNFLYAPPYLTLRIHSSKDVITTALLVIVGLSVGEIVRYARRKSSLAGQRRLDIGGLHALSEMVRLNAPRRQITDTAAELLRRELALNACRFESIDDEQTALPAIDHRGLIDHPLRHAPGGFELPTSGVSIPVRNGHLPAGQFVLLPSTHHGVSLLDRQLAVLVADVVAPALTPADR